MKKSILHRVAEILGVREIVADVLSRIIAFIALIVFLYLMPYLLPPIFKMLFAVGDMISKHPPAPIVFPQP
jgi:hypothetical protein